MKIFNWVHRRFHHKDEVGKDAKKAEFVTKENDTLALLENAALASVFDSWSILTIGTLGLYAMNGFEPKEDNYVCVITPGGENENEHEELLVGDDEKEDDQVAEMERPLMLQASKHGFHDQKDDVSQCDHKNAKTNAQEDAVEEKSADLEIVQGNKVRKSGERVTLADLFWGDTEKNMLKNISQKKLADDQAQVCYTTTATATATEYIKKQVTNEDGVFFFKKKKPAKEDSARPIKKINRLMRKMLKRKIHPDMESQKKENTSRMKPVDIVAGSVVEI